VSKAETQLAGFIDRYTPDVAGQAREVLERMRRLAPGAVELVYDNYNALVIGFGPSERASAAVLSVVVYPRWVTLCFLQGVGLADPTGLLKGKGSRVRHIVLTAPEVLDQPAVQDLIREALLRGAEPIDPRAEPRLVIKSISPRQRPRRP
jgi:hypothetical protein